MRAVHFGAGNIGRGFIGLMLSRAGYQVIFVDVNDQIVEALQQRGEYNVTLANKNQTIERVTDVTAIHGSQLEEVAAAISRADIVTTAIGVSILPHIAKVLAEGIRRRIEQTGNPLHIIACENTIGGSSQLKSHVYEVLNEEERLAADRIIAFPNAAVDRIVPLQHHDDPLTVTVEPFFEWIIDRSAMFPEYPIIDRVEYVDTLAPYIARKLFTVNTGHCCAAYYGYLQGYETIQGAMQDDDLRSEVHGALEETGQLLCHLYGFERVEHKKYILKVLDRFTNRYLTDDVRRVGRSPIRKLSPNDRLVKPALLACELGFPVAHLTTAIVAALRFDELEDTEAVELQNALRDRGIHEVIVDYLGIAGEHPLHTKIVQQYEETTMVSKKA
ncbi:MAG: mannitol-1-phosphate 5-dehydrogenase [Paenibacillaceae bacterium]